MKVTKIPQRPAFTITHNDYQNVEITKKGEEYYFLRLYANDMRLLDCAKKL